MPIFKFKRDKNRFIFYIFGIRLVYNINPFKFLDKKFRKNKHFDCRKFDMQIAQISEQIFKNHEFTKNPINNNRIGILATLFSDMGGHTECVVKLAEMLSEQYEVCTFLSQKNIAYEWAKNKMPLLEKYSKVDGLDCGEKKDLIELFDKINQFSPRVLFVYMHMDDSFDAGVLYLLHKYTDIKIIYCNHGSHCPALGMSFADAIGNTSDSTFYVNKVYRGFDKNVYFNLMDDKKENIIDISEEEKLSIRKGLGIKEGNYFTLSGATSYKFFENGTSPYFEMIKRLLAKEPNLQHVVITKFSDEEKQVFEKIFENSQEKDRLKILNFTSEYSKLFQSCDVFVDSFPMASAFAHVEMMKHKGVSVVKINTKNALYSFQEYFPKDYKYKFAEVFEMEDGIIELLHNPEKRKIVGEELYKHYLDNFELSKAKNEFINIIENSEHIEDFYVHLDENLKFNVEIEK